MQDELLASPWDLLLCSAGGLSAPLSEFTKNAGRHSIDVGKADIAHKPQMM